MAAPNETVGGHAEWIAGDAEEDLVVDTQRQMFDCHELRSREARGEPNPLIGQYAGGKADDRRTRGQAAGWRCDPNAGSPPIDARYRRGEFDRQARAIGGYQGAVAFADWPVMPRIAVVGGIERRGLVWIDAIDPADDRIQQRSSERSCG